MTKTMKTCMLRIDARQVVEALSDGERQPCSLRTKLPAEARLLTAYVDSGSGELVLGFEHSSEELQPFATISPEVTTHPGRDEELELAARALFAKLDSITTEEFSLGVESAELEALRVLLEARRR